MDRKYLVLDESRQAAKICHQNSERKISCKSNQWYRVNLQVAKILITRNLLCRQVLLQGCLLMFGITQSSSGKPSENIRSFTESEYPYSEPPIYNL